MWKGYSLCPQPLSQEKEFAPCSTFCHGSSVSPSPHLNKCSHTRSKRVLLELEELEQRIELANIPVVNTLGDDPNGPFGGGAVTLRDAIGDAMSPGNAGGIVSFKAGLTGSIGLAKALPTLSQNVTIQGNGLISVDGGGQNNPFTILQVNQGVTVEINNLQINAGYALGTNGGAIYNSGTLTLNNDTFEGNETAANNNAGGSGGAIFNASGAQLTAVSCDFHMNNASGFGGAIANLGTLLCQACTMYVNGANDGGAIANLSNGESDLRNATQIYSNSATTFGGGIYEGGGKVTVSGHSAGSKEIYKNQAPNGGGIYVVNGTLTLMQGVTINANKATAGSGGGIYIAGGTVTASSGYIDNNTATNNGGGIYNLAGSLTLNGSEQIGPGNSAIDGGGVYLGASSKTIFSACTVSGNKATGQGVGIAYEQNATLNELGLTDLDDPNGPVEIS